MSSCPNCRAPLRPNTGYCTKCGAALSGSPRRARSHWIAAALVMVVAAAAVIAVVVISGRGSGSQSPMAFSGTVVSQSSVASATGEPSAGSGGSLTPGWTAQTSGTTHSLVAVDFVDAEHGWAVGAKGTILATSDAGATWVPQESGVDATVVDVSFVDPLRGWAAVEDGTVLVTQDGGQAWTRQFNTTGGGMAAISFADASHGWAVGGQGSETVLRTSDAGASWQADSLQIEGDYPWQLAPVDVERCWLLAEWDVGEAAGVDIFWTDNAGLRWRRVSEVTGQSVHAMTFADAKTGWLAGWGGRVLRSSDGGRRWIQQETGSQAYLAAIVALDEARVWAVGDGGTILATQDGGARWMEQSSGTHVALYDVCFSDSAHGWAVGAHGAILATGDGGGS